MSIDSRNNFENSPSIEARIHAIVWEIEKEYKFWKNTLEKLMAFKLEKEKESISQKTGDYKTELIKEIKKEAIIWEISSQNNETLSEKQYQILAEKLIEISKLKEKTQSGIEALRTELIKDIFSDNIFGSNTLITKWWYHQETLHRVENPKNFSDHIIWFWIWCIETWVVCWKLLKDAIVWIAKAPFDAFQIAKWEATFESNIKV